MTFWESLLLTFGGATAALVLAGWLARSLISQLLAKDLEKFKADLTAAATLASEQTKHQLQIATLERQVVFSKLHEKRAEAIAELYSLLLEAQWAAEDFASPMEMTGEASKSEKFRTALNKSVEFYRFFARNRIYLPPRVCAQLEEILKVMRSKVIGFGAYVRLDESGMPDESIRKKLDAWIEASRYFNEEAPKAREALEAELRAIIGASDAGAS